LITNTLEISLEFQASKNLSFIAVTCNSALRIGMDDITGFLGL
jgi:hypothetical protein